MTTTRTFTFGGGHINPATGASLKDHYVVIEGKSAEHCRATMLNHFGTQWSFEYWTPEDAGLHRFNLRELPRDQWPASSESYIVNYWGACVPAEPEKE